MIRGHVIDNHENLENRFTVPSEGTEITDLSHAFVREAVKGLKPLRSGDADTSELDRHWFRNSFVPCSALSQTPKPMTPIYQLDL